MTSVRGDREARARREGSGGFTLVETAIALIVLMVSGLAAASLFMYAINYNTGANDRAIAQSVAQKQMELLRKTPFSQVASSTQTVAAAGRTYSVVTTICNDGSAACGGTTKVKKITVQVTPQAAGGAWATSAVTLITMRSDLSTGAYF